MNDTVTPIKETQIHAVDASENIFSGMVDYSPLEKSMKNARIWLYVISGMQLILGSYDKATELDPVNGWLAFGIGAGIGMNFLGRALWSWKKPRLAFTLALILYVFFNISFMVLDPSNILKGILIKAIIVVALIKANKNARKYEEIRNSIGEQI